MLFDVDAAGGENRRRTLESLDIMLRVWQGEPFEFRRRVLERCGSRPATSTSSGST